MRHPELAKFIQDHALQLGDFTLASGARSPFYLDVRKVSFHPRGVQLIVLAISDEIGGRFVGSIGGMDMGATPIVAAFSLLSGELGYPVRSFVVRKEIKPHGTMRPIEGCWQAGDQVVVVDDVMTSGGSMLRAIDAIRHAGMTVIKAIAVVDRNAGGGERMREAGVDYQALVTLEDLGIG